MSAFPVYSYFHATTGTGLVVKPGPGVLGGVSINKTVVGTVTIKDGGTTMAVLAATSGVGMYLNSRIAFASLNFTSTASTEDVTIIYE